jgi:hypothetical protein
MRVLSILAACLAMSACAAGAPSSAPAAAGAGEGLESLRYAHVTANGVRVRVDSNGCTDADSFDVDVAEVQAGDGGASYQVTLRRKRPDICGRPQPGGEPLQFSREELGVPAGASITVANPVGRVRR